MPRPTKCRRVCGMPTTEEFVPVGGSGKTGVIELAVDEYEAIRLIDREGLSQEECGQHMGVARTTIQQIYTTARKKIADALVEGRPLRIMGGQYRICGEEDLPCGCGMCRRRRALMEMEPQREAET